MTQRRRRVLIVASHPVQYASPLFRVFAGDPRLEVQVAYCSLQSAEPALDPDFGVQLKWDVPLLEGYPWSVLPNLSPTSRFGLFFKLFNPGVWHMIRRGNFDAVILFTGYMCITFWIAIAAAKSRGIPVLFGTDATSLRPRDGKRWKLVAKKFLLPKIFRLADIVIIPSEAGRQFIVSLGIQESQICLTPFVADNPWWKEQASKVERNAVRRNWGVPETAVVALFCAKLQPWKRPDDALLAFARANVDGSFLVFVGEGPMRAHLEAKARSLGIGERTLFLGFVNQTGLPAVYRCADLFILPSEYDPCPVVVCEAMLCGCPVVLSDEIRGRFDLVKNGETGFIYPCGNVDALASILVSVLADRAKLAALSRAASTRMEVWSPRESVDAIALAVERAQTQRRQ